MAGAEVTENFFETDFSNHIVLLGWYDLGMYDQDGNSADVRKGTAEPGPGADRQVCPRGAPRPSTLGLASTSSAWPSPTSREPEPHRQGRNISTHAATATATASTTAIWLHASAIGERGGALCHPVLLGPGICGRLYGRVQGHIAFEGSDQCEGIHH